MTGEHLMTKKRKAVLLIIIAAALLAVTAFLLCAIPTETEWHRTVKCFESMSPEIDFSLPDDTKLEDLTDFVEVECDFTVVHTLSYTRIKGGTIRFYDKEYNVSDCVNCTVDRPVTWIALNNKNDHPERYPTVSDHLFLSHSRKYIELFGSRANGSGSFHRIGGCETIGELKDALKDLGYNVPTPPSE